MELLQLVDIRVEEATRPLREEVAMLKLLLAHVGDSLEPVETCTSDGMELASAQASFLFDSIEQKSYVVEEKQLYGCLSPCGSPCLSPQHDVAAASEGEVMDVILAPLLPLPVTPELQELELGSSKALTVATAASPPQSPAFVSSGVLAYSSEALFGKELCGLLASLEAVSPGYGKDIACVLAGKASNDIIRKVEKSFRKISIWGKRRRRG
jgi:hypothetical protein